MKKLIFLALICIFGVATYSNRRHVFHFLFAHYFNRPQKLEFSKIAEGRILIFYVNSDYLSSRISEISKRVAANLSAAESQLGIRLDSGMKVYLYNNWEEKGNDVRNIRLAHADAKANSIYCIVSRDYDGLKERVEYELLLNQRYGAPVRPELSRFTAAALGGIWNQKTLTDWARFLSARKLWPSFPAFFSVPETVSEFVIYPWNGMFVKFLKEKYGWDAMIRFYKQGQTPAGYETQWRIYIANFNQSPIETPVFHPEFQKGISYAYRNGYSGGYASRKSGQSLDELKQIGVNWVAAIPYGFMESPGSAEVHFAGHSIFGESDESMLALVKDAKARGLKVMLKPQLWMDFESWPGRIDFPDQNQWNRYMDSYENWITHYAILSELIGVDLLCVGTEMVQSTLKQPDRWRKIIGRVRDIYHGPLVYAANYGKEFEGIAFWDSLDYLGLDNYYPVRTSSNQGIDAIKEGFLKQREKLKVIALKYQKPLLFTEIGYMANDGAGMGPEELNFSQYNEKLQAECYRLALETYWDQPWFSGMYWWKWFSDVSDRGRQADRHSPHGREAEAVLRQWYKRSRNS